MSAGIFPQRNNILPDMIAGLTLAVVKIPQSMANAVLASVNPIAGLYALMIAMPVAALTSSSVFMNVATTGALAIAVGEALYHVPAQEKTSALVLLVLLIGIAQLVLGLLKVGRLTRYISNSVMSGFVLGIAFLIISTSIRDMTGFESHQPFHLLRLAETALNWRHLNFYSVMIGTITVLSAMLISSGRYGRYSLAFALCLATGLGLGIDALRAEPVVVRIGDVAYITDSLPVPHLPSLERISELVLPALSIAIVGLIQTTSVNQSFPNPDGRFPDTSKDFASLGIANIASSFFGAIPTAGSLSGTAIAIRAGARSRWANLFSGVAVVCVVLTAIDIVSLIPIAALGGLLFVIGLQNIQPVKIREIWRTGLVSRIALCGTAVATLVLPLHFAILSGVALSFFLQVLHLANRLEIRQWHLVEGGFPVDYPVPNVLEENEVCVAYIKGVMFFASARTIEQKLPQPNSARPAVLVLDLQNVDELGSTVVRFLAQYSSLLSKAGNKLVLAGVSETLFLQLERTSILKTIRREDIHKKRDSSGASINEAVLASRNWIDGQAILRKL